MVDVVLLGSTLYLTVAAEVPSGYLKDPITDQFFDLKLFEFGTTGLAASFKEVPDSWVRFALTTDENWFTPEAWARTGIKVVAFIPGSDDSTHIAMKRSADLRIGIISKVDPKYRMYTKTESPIVRA